MSRPQARTGASTSRRTWIAAVCLLALASSACGSSGAESGKRVTLTVLAAASLKNAFPAIGSRLARADRVVVQFSFAGTDQLAAQIEQGSPADVFAAASPKYGEQLAGEGLIEPPVPFCTNSLVLVLPPSNPAGIASLLDLARPGVKLVVGAESVPVGTYTRAVLRNLNASLGSGYSSRVLANVVTDEENVEGVLAKVRLGEADAGFVYVTDAKAAGSDVVAIDLPEDAQAMATYQIAVVRATAHPAEARRFVDLVLGADAQAVLREAGFGPPPGS